jgi:Sulfotransferase family
VRTFAIAGAPKAATTALAVALERHPEIAFSIPKEPYWFGSDLEPLRRRQGLRTPADYRACFEQRPRQSARWRGEASTLYLSSPDAIAQLDDELPDSLVICVVRNPVEVAHAFHMQMVFAGFESLVDFGEAWAARERRVDDPPATCPVPRLLQYEQIAALGRQVERVVDRVGAERTHIIVYDDLLDDPESVLRALGERLALSHPPEDPGQVNGAMVLRSPRLAHALRSGPGRRAARLAKSKLPAGLTRTLLASKDRLLTRSQPRRALPEPLREELVEVFASEVSRLEAILARDLGHWSKLPQPGRAA